MRRERGFTLIEAAITAVILTVGVVALIEINRATSRQIFDNRRSQGQPAIAERLLHDQYEAIMVPASAPVPPTGVPPLGLDGVVYQVTAADLGATSPAPGVTQRCYRLQVLFGTPPAALVPFVAGPRVAPSLTVCRN